MHSLGLTVVGGEFADRDRERAFRAAHLDEAFRHVRLMLLLSACLNVLFIASDWRFQGQPWFFAAVPARIAIIAVALGCLAALRRARDFDGAQAVMIAWEWLTAFPAAVLVVPHTQIAFMVVHIMPTIYWLVVPTAFRWTVAGGIGCSALMLTGYLWTAPWDGTGFGVIMAMATLNVILMLVVMRANRLRRKEWAATQAERRAKEELAESRAQIERLFMAVPLPLLVSSMADGKLLKANDAAIDYFGADPKALRVESMHQLHVDPERRQDLLAAVAAAGRVSGFEAQARLADGAVRDVLVAASTIEVGGEPCLMSSVTDITERKRLEADLRQMATTDQLTGLANRHQFFRLAQHEILRARRYVRPLAVLMADIDHFKTINDTFGHEVGDAVLKAFAEMCRRALRPMDVVGRMGGEEFAFLLPETDRADALAVAERLRFGAEDLRFEDGLRLTVSVGVSGLLSGEDTIEAALSRADKALYEAKRAGRNGVADDPAVRVPVSEGEGGRP